MVDRPGDGKAHGLSPVQLPRQPLSTGFTLLELLVVVAVIVIVASLLLSSLISSGAKGQAIQCLNNLRQIQLAWLAYADDNNDKLVSHGFEYEAWPSTKGCWWAQGVMTYDDSSQNTNTLLLVDPRYALLGSYARFPQLYRCPSDRSRVKIGGNWFRRVRSVTMNNSAGFVTGCLGSQAVPLGFQKLTQIVDPPPEKFFVFIDEHPDSIWFITFFVARPEKDYQQGVAQSYPACNHSGAGTISFADGHVELHKWLDPRTKPAFRSKHVDSSLSVLNNPDVAWLRERSYPSE